MKALLNFLPAENRKEVQKNLMSLVILRFTTFLVILIIIFGGSLFGIKFLLDEEIKRIQTEQQTVASQSQDSETVDVESAIKSLNKQTSRLEAVQNDHVYWSIVLSRLYSIIPEGVSMSNMNINSGEKTGTLTGIATTRDSYYELENLLEASEYIANAEVPISLLKTDIQFSISITFTDKLFVYET